MGQSSPEFIIFCLCMFVYGAEFGWVQLLSLSTGQSLRLGPTSRLSTGQSLAGTNFSFVYGAEFGWDQLLVCGAEIHLITFVCGAEIYLIVCLWGGDPSYRLSMGQNHQTVGVD